MLTVQEELWRGKLDAVLEAHMPGLTAVTAVTAVTVPIHVRTQHPRETASPRV